MKEKNDDFLIVRIPKRLKQLIKKDSESKAVRPSKIIRDILEKHYRD